MPAVAWFEELQFTAVAELVAAHAVSLFAVQVLPAAVPDRW